MTRLSAASAFALVTLTIGSVSSQDKTPPKDIAETVLAVNNFGILSKAVNRAHLFEVLKGPGPFTLLAPTDDAFGKLPQGSLDKLLNQPDQLKRVLTFHVIPGKHSSEEIKKMTTAKTLEGGTLHIRFSGGKILANNAAITNPDIECTNGVIHVVDSVLMPK